MQNTKYGAERKVNGVPTRLADISRAKNLLGFKPSISLEEGLRGLVDWWRKMHSIPVGKETV
jgi:nucleoside-diphosphate-sugar epimerase